MRYQLRYVRMLSTGYAQTPALLRVRTLADSGSPDQAGPGSRQLVGDHLVERMVNVHPESFVTG
jgi:hypothetical protein